MRPLNIYITRHGESLGNVNWQTYYEMEDADVPLTTNGKVQAASLGLVVNEKVHGSIALYSSHYYRACQTAEILSGMLGNKIFVRKIDQDLRELKWCDHKSVDVRTPEIETAQRKHMGGFRTSNPGGESPYQVWRRQAGVIERLEDDFKSISFPQNLLIVSHGITMLTLIMRLTGIPQKEYETLATPRNCELIHLKQDGLKWEAVTTIRRKETA